MGDRKPISLEDIKKLSQGELIDIPDWENESTICIKVRHADLTPDIIASGIIPTELILEAEKVFDPSKESTEEASEKILENMKKDDQGMASTMQRMMPLLNVVCTGVMVEPKFKEVEAIRPMTLPQKLAVFSWAMSGMKKLKPFRSQQ